MCNHRSFFLTFTLILYFFFNCRHQIKKKRPKSLSRIHMNRNPFSISMFNLSSSTKTHKSCNIASMWRKVHAHTKIYVAFNLFSLVFLLLTAVCQIFCNNSLSILFINYLFAAVWLLMNHIHTNTDSRT